MYCLENKNLKGKKPPFTQTLDHIGNHPEEPTEMFLILHGGPQLVCTLE